MWTSVRTWNSQHAGEVLGTVSQRRDRNARQETFVFKPLTHSIKCSLIVWTTP